jgi:hypothetical protein
MPSSSCSHLLAGNSYHSPQSGCQNPVVKSMKGSERKAINTNHSTHVQMPGERSWRVFLLPWMLSLGLIDFFYFNSFSHVEISYNECVHHKWLLLKIRKKHGIHPFLVDLCCNKVKPY